tara:strand:- start:5390 stop:5671 length:282 start_codon:yes stop_codon:yes gene_type:complete
MHFKPFNRHIVVDIIEEEQVDESVIVLPSDYEKPLSHYAKVIVIEVSRDSKFYDSLETNDTILVERRMLHKIEIDNFSFYLVLENYILGRIDT